MCEKGCPTMDHERFDALSRALASARPRRGVLGLVLGATLLGHGSSVFAEPGKAKGKSRSKDGNQGHETGKGRSHAFGKACARLACDKQPVHEKQESEFCCNGGSCSCDGDCCPGRCFQKYAPNGDVTPDRHCCPKPKDGGIMCENEKGEFSCCVYDPAKSEEENCREGCALPWIESGLIAGSYRRR
jgi:hypothetical protein